MLLRRTLLDRLKQYEESIIELAIVKAEALVLFGVDEIEKEFKTASENMEKVKAAYDRGYMDAITDSEKRMPQKPVLVEDKMWTCPICGNNLMHKYKKYPTLKNTKKDALMFCLSCGCRIDWEDITGDKA